MKKIFTFIAVVSLATCSFAEVKNDTLTVQSLGISLTSGSYAAYNSTQSSGAEFYAYSLRNYTVVTVQDSVKAKDTVRYDLQLRGNNKVPFSGIVATKSDLNVAKVILNWGANTTSSRDVAVYGSTVAYTNADSLNAKIEENRGTLLGKMTFVPKTDTTELVNHTELDITGDYPYIGIRMAGTTAAYFENIIIGYKKESSIIYDTLTVKSFNVDLAIGSYAAYTDTTQKSGVEYYGYILRNIVTKDTIIYSNRKDTTGITIQLRGNAKTPFSGIVMTKSNQHDVKKVILNWASSNSANSRSVEVYGSKNAYTDADSLNAKIAANRTDLLGTMTYVPQTDSTTLINHTELEIPAGYPFIGIRMASSAAYFDNIIIVYYEETTAIESLTAAQKSKTIYNLNGQKVNKNCRPGLYIQNGKKVFIK